jgi:hypothetical protein
MKPIFKLFGEIAIDSSKSDKAIDGATGKAKKLMGGLGKVAIAGGAAFAAVGAGAFAAANKAAETTDRIDKMSQKLGISREGFQEWDFILSQSGTSIDSMSAGMKTLTNSVDDLRKGTGAGSEAFERLGISMEDLEGKSQEEVFEMTVTALQGVTDETERAALANDLLGRSGQELAPLLNAGADSIDAMKEQAHDLGLVMGDEAIDAGVQFTDTMDQLKRTFGTVVAEVGTALMPIFQEMANWVIEHMPEIKAAFKVAFDVISTVVGVVVDLFTDHVIPILKQFWDWVEPYLPKIQEAFEVAFGGIKTAVEAVVSAFKSVINWAGRAWDKVKSVKNSISNAGSAIAGFFGFGGGQDVDGMRANGGPVRAGGSYVVGERGPEIFTPSTSGSIIPNGGGGISIRIDAGNIVGANAGDELGDMLVEILRRKGVVTA